MFLLSFPSSTHRRLGIIILGVGCQGEEYCQVELTGDALVSLGNTKKHMTAPFWTDQLLVDLISEEQHAVGAWLKHHEELSPFFASPQALLHYTYALRHGLRPGLREGNLPELEGEYDPWIEAGW